MVKRASKKKPAKSSGGKQDFKHRDILWTPWRHEYIKGGVQEKGPKECVFCTAIRKGSQFESLILDTSEHCAVILNKYPYNNGHTMVIPKLHTPDMASLPEEVFTDLHIQLRRACRAIQQAYNPQGMNIGMNMGKMAGAGIADHIHYHLLPRWGGDTNFMPLLGGTKVISETLDQTYARLLPYFKKSGEKA